MKIRERIKRRIYNYFHPSLEDGIRRFSSNGDWAFFEMDKWSRRFDRIGQLLRGDKEQ